MVSYSTILKLMALMSVAASRGAALRSRGMAAFMTQSSGLRSSSSNSVRSSSSRAVRGQTASHLAFSWPSRRSLRPLAALSMSTAAAAAATSDKADASSAEAATAAADSPEVPVNNPLLKQEALPHFESIEPDSVVPAITYLVDKMTKDFQQLEVCASIVPYKMCLHEAVSSCALQRYACLARTHARKVRVQKVPVTTHSTNDKHSPVPVKVL